MTTRLYSHGACLDHDTGPGHPERVDRLRAVLAALEGDEFGELDRAEAPEASREQLARGHAQAYVEQIFELAPSEESLRLDPDTVMSPGSLEATRRAAGAVVAAEKVERLVVGSDGEVQATESADVE